MKQRLNVRETVTVASMLFGLFFGAGNLIFPLYLGQQAGQNLWQAILGFLLTGVGLPLLGVAAFGISQSHSLQELGGKVGKGYGLFFTCGLYLTIGPFFAIPRCATTPFTVGLVPLLPDGVNDKLILGFFSLVFFGAVLGFSLRPGKILTWVGKILNPVFLAFLGVFLVTALLLPLGRVSAVPPQASYTETAFFQGFLEGYHTMDALAGLAFGIVVVTVIRDLGVKSPGAVTASTVRAGVFSCLIMAVIYVAVALVGAQSRGLYPPSDNGGEAFGVLAQHYFGKAGLLLLAVTVLLACLKTAVGLTTSCAETFVSIFPKGISYRVWAVLFCLLSFLIANLGLDAIIRYSLPVLMFLYPLAITLILLCLGSRWFGQDKVVFRWVTGFTLAAAFLDFLQALPTGVQGVLRVQGLLAGAARFLPFFSMGIGWVIPALVGLGIGLVHHGVKRRR